MLKVLQGPAKGIAKQSPLREELKMFCWGPQLGIAKQSPIDMVRMNKEGSGGMLKVLQGPAKGIAKQSPIDSEERKDNRLRRN